MRGRKKQMLRGAVLAVFALTQWVSIAAHGQIALPGGACLVEADPSWSEVESWVWSRVCVGQIADLRERDDLDLDPRSAEGWGDERLVSPRFLEAILMHEKWASAVPRLGVLILGAFFRAPLDLTDGHIEAPLWLGHSRFAGPVTMDRMVTPSYVSLDGSCVRGQLSMDSVTIGQSLNMRESKFTDVILLGAEIGQQLSIIRTTVSGILRMNEITIGGSLIMAQGEFVDDVILWGADIDGVLSMDGTKISGTLDLTLAAIGDDVFMSDGQFTETVTGSSLRIGGSLDLRQATFLSLDLTNAYIGRELTLASPDLDDPVWLNGGGLFLRNTVTGALQDTPNSWPRILELDGFVYQSLGGLGGSTGVADRGSNWYTDWLALSEPFSPQPYEQLASVLQTMGHEREMNDVLYSGKERARALAWEDGQYLRAAGQMLLNYTIGYGLGTRYFRSLYWILGIVLLGWGVLWLSGQNRFIEQDGKPELKLGFFCSLDLLLPIIRLRERHYEVDLENPARLYFYFHQIMGYVLASFLIAGLSGLTN